MKIAIIICGRYGSCDGAKCFRALNSREGAFSRYPKDEPLDVVAYTTCGGCPGGNVENTVKGMKKYGAQAIHFATGMLAGYPPCLYLADLKAYTEKETGLPVIVGTHPMPTNYIERHTQLNDWTSQHKEWLAEFHQMDPLESEKYDSSRPDYWDRLAEEY